MLFKAGKVALKAYGAVSGAVHTIRHPIQATQDAIRGFLVDTLVKLLVKVAGEAVAEQLVSRISLEKSFQQTVAIPKGLRGVVLDEDALAFATKVVNDAMAVPLAALNLTLGELVIQKAADAPNHLEVLGVFKLVSASSAEGLARAAAAPRALPAPAA